MLQQKNIMPLITMILGTEAIENIIIDVFILLQSSSGEVVEAIGTE